MRRALAGGLAALTVAGCGGTVTDTTKTVTVPAKSKPVTSAQIVAAFQRAGLPAQDPRPMTTADYGLAPKLTSDATRFLIPSLGADAGGRAFVLHNGADLATLKAYYDNLSRSSAALSSWVLTNPAKNVLVQINNRLPQAQANAYQRVLAGL